ncbi:hypothetical protein MMC25_001982 [Agyrium rufum]|nr:hypothetical protein [Agyrium rufum]
MMKDPTSSHRDGGKPSLEPNPSAVDSLSTALERYLELLHPYHDVLRPALQKHLSSGFFSLAEANFKSPNRIRYGQDCYDQRMQTSLNVSIEDSGSAVKIQPLTFESSPKAAERPKDKEAATSGDASQNEGEPHENEESETGSEPRKEPLIKDPLRWFGILVPAALRHAQKDFKSIVLEDVPEIIRIQRELAQLETEIRSLRALREKHETKGS